MLDKLDPATENLPQVCGRCFAEAPLFPADCCESPEQWVNLGMYHCPDCGAMVLGGLPHPYLCLRCLALDHPDFDKVPENALDDGINYPGSQQELLWIVGSSVVSILALLAVVAASHWGLPW